MSSIVVWGLVTLPVSASVACRGAPAGLPTFVAADEEDGDASGSSVVLLDLTKPFDRSLRATLDEIDEHFLEYEFRSGLAWTTSPGTAAHPEHGVIVNRDQLKSLVERHGEAWRDLIHYFVLAHEKAHLVQFRELGIPQALAVPYRVSEAQADLMAGAAAAARLLADPRNHPQLGFQILVDLVQGEGVNTHRWCDHPTPEQRKSAVEQGLRYQEAATRLQRGEITESGLREELGVAPATGFFAWSLAQSKRIVGIDFDDEGLLELPIGDLSAHRALQAGRWGPRTVEWHPDPADGTVDYSLPFTNVSNRRIRGALLVESGHVPRDATGADFSAWKLFSVGRHAIDLPPGQRTRIEGTLRWLRLLDTMPRLRERWSVSFVDGPEEEDAFRRRVGWKRSATTDGASEVRLLTAIEEADMESFLEVLEQGVDVDACVWYEDGDRELKGVTPLICAIQERDTRMALHLIEECGADPFLESLDSQPPLHEAASRGDVRVMAALLRRGVHPDLQSTDSAETALHLAARGSELEAVYLLAKDHGADVEATDEYESTPFLEAGLDDVDVLRALVELGADPHRRTTSGRSIVHRIRYADDVEEARRCLDYLIGLGVEINARDRQGRTALARALAHLEEQRADLAAARSEVEIRLNRESVVVAEGIVELLREKGALQ